MRTTRLILCAFVLLALALPAKADPRDERIDELELQVARLRQELEAVISERHKLQAEYEERLDRQQAARSEEQMKAMERIEALHDEVAALRDEGERRLRDSLRQHDSQSALRRLLDEARPLVVHLLDSENDELRSTALEVALQAGFPEAAEKLGPGLDSNDLETRLRSAEGLLRLRRYGEVLPRLREWAKDAPAAFDLLAEFAPQTELRALGAMAARHGEDAVVTLSMRLVDLDDGSAFSVIAEHGDPGSETVRKLIERFCGGPAPEGLELGEVWSLCRSASLAEFTASASTLRKICTHDLTIEVGGLPIDKAVAYFADLSGTKWVCLPGEGETRVDYTCENLNLYDAARELLGKADLEFRILDGFVVVGHPDGLAEDAVPTEHPVLLPPWRADESARLRKIRNALSLCVTAVFEDVALGEALHYLSLVAEFQLVRLPSAGEAAASINLQAKALPVSSILRRLCEECELVVRLRWGVLLIGTLGEFTALGEDSDLETASTGSGEVRDVLDLTVVSIDFDETPIDEALTFLGGVANVPISIPEDLDAQDLLVTLQLDNVSVLNALRCILRPHEMTHRIEKDGVRVVPFPE